MKITEELIIKKLGLKTGVRYVRNGWEVILLMPNGFIRKADAKVYPIKMLIGDTLEEIK